MSEKDKRSHVSEYKWLIAFPVVIFILLAVGLSSNEPSEPEINYTLFLFTDREEYDINEDVNISGFLMYGDDPVVNWSISVLTYVKNIPHSDQLKTNEDGYFNTKVYIPGTTSEGLHKILAVASGLGVSNESYFTISFDGSGTAVEYPETIKAQNSQSLTVWASSNRTPRSCYLCFDCGNMEKKNKLTPHMIARIEAFVNGEG